MPIADQDFGKLIESVSQLVITTQETRTDVKELVKYQVRTEERLSTGAKHFETLDKKVDGHEKELAAMPSGKLVYLLITLGFGILGALITVYKFVKD
jgi:hypothetical protein